MILKIIYTLFVGILLATFVGVGIQAFYPPPVQPNFSGPIATPYGVQDASMSAQYESSSKPMLMPKTPI